MKYCRRLAFAAAMTLTPTSIQAEQIVDAAAQPGIKPFEAADYLQSGEDCAQYLQACMDEAPEDDALFTKAVGDIARARGMMQLARDTGITEKGLTRPWASKATPALRPSSKSCTRLACSSTWVRGRRRGG
jgi:probable addiction module antidote protein